MMPYPPGPERAPQRQPVTSGLTKPSTHLALSVVAIVCSLLFGIIGLFFSFQVTTRWDKGDVSGAQKASTTALIVDVIGIVIGVIFLFAALSSGNG
jgi:hypothetical protein